MCIKAVHFVQMTLYIDPSQIFFNPLLKNSRLVKKINQFNIGVMHTKKQQKLDSICIGNFASDK